MIGIIRIYPNPVKDFLYFDTIENIKSARFYNSLGQLVKETKDKKIDFRNFKSGVYILQLNTDNQIINKRIIKK
ncbi:T9SS type A sorting domain-containing protein [Algibacter sp.]|uniref:T9SS type A sorting domain-containing protein n=1 Tax=Algibacter sp. TaxID=1872428 RepID=UPI00344910FF